MKKSHDMHLALQFNHCILRKGIDSCPMEAIKFAVQG